MNVVRSAVMAEGDCVLAFIQQLYEFLRSSLEHIQRQHAR
jgi:hypothetical protein